MKRLVTGILLVLAGLVLLAAVFGTGFGLGYIGNAACASGGTGCILIGVMLLIAAIGKKKQ